MLNSSRLPALALLAALASGCSAPIVVNQLSPREAERAQYAFGLTTNKPSDFSQIVLRRYDLLERFPDDPAGCLASLHALAASESVQPDELFALAELSYLYAADGAGRSYYLASALYAYALLFPGPDVATFDLIDPRTRMAADIYARALTAAFENPEDQVIEPAGGPYDLPFGHLGVAFDERSLWIRDGRFVDLRPASDMEITGLRNRYRKAGIGAALSAHVDAPPGSLIERYTNPALRIPATLLLRVDRPRDALRTTELAATLEFVAFSSDASVTIDGDRKSLESEPSVALAMTLAESEFWNAEMSRCLGSALNVTTASRLQISEPYRPGRIPVVFVHGTNSSPARWADMLNDLENDPRVHDHFTFWAFSYMSSRPIALSAADLRRELSEAVRILDPETTNACIQDMIVIGHSQGGLLTKMTAIDSGDRFWRTLSSEPFERALMSNDTRKIVKEALFVKPLPFVRRVVFVATPHRGSFLAGPQFVRRLIARLVTLPLDVVKASTELAAATLNGRASSESAASLERVPTSIDNMSPGNRFIRTLSDIPLSPDVKAHSIIPVDTDGPVEEGNDGVVKYKSAHIEGVESELVVRSPHSVQSNPYAIEEVRRILLLHLSESGCDGHGDGLANQSPAEPL